MTRRPPTFSRAKSACVIDLLNKARDKQEIAEFEELADFAERGELHPIPGTTVRGEAARQEARELMMSATGAETPEEAARRAVGRPRAGESAGPPVSGSE